MKILRWLGDFAVVAYLCIWAAAVPLYVSLAPIFQAEPLQSVPAPMLLPAILAAAGSEPRPIRAAWLSSFSPEESFEANPIRQKCLAELDWELPQILAREEGHYDLVMMESSPYFGKEATRRLVRKLLERTRRGGIVVLPLDMRRCLPRSAGWPLILPGDGGARFIAVSPDAEHFPDTDPEDSERRLRILAGDEYWPRGVYPALYPAPGRRIDIPPESPRRPLFGEWPFRVVLIAVTAAAALWLGARLTLARRESVAWVLCRGENAAAFALALLLAARMSCRLEFRIGSTPWDILPLIPLFWIGGGIFFRGRAVAWAVPAAVGALVCFCREEWAAAGHGWLFGVSLLLTVLVAASERRLLREERPLARRSAFFAEAGGFVVAFGLWLLLRRQPFASQMFALGIPAMLCRLAACRNLF